MRTLTYLAEVARWWPLVVQVIAAEGAEGDLRPEVVLAIIHVESDGQHRHRGIYRGLTQVGPRVANETYTDPSTPIGSIEAFVRWAQKYESLHFWDPYRLALGWKAGVGTLAAWNRGSDRDRLLARWNTGRYLDLFDQAINIWGPRACPTEE